MTVPLTPLQRETTAAKQTLEQAKEALTAREWHTLRACLLIWLTADEEREREVA